MVIKKTTDYFGMTVDELLEEGCERGWTREECKLYDEALHVTFFDNLNEWEEEQNEFKIWISKMYPDMKCKAILETVNERIVVLYS